MARNTVPLSQVIKDFIITLDGDDYASNASDSAIRNLALRGIREIGFDISKKIKSLKLIINSTNNTVELPDDFVDLLKIGIVDPDGLVRVFGNNKHINQSMSYTNTGDGLQEPLFTSTGAHDSNNDGVFDRIEDKTSTQGSVSSSENLNDFIFDNYLHEGTVGRLYGAGGGHLAGEYRLNLEQNRIEVETNNAYTHVVVEYIADEARSANPDVHVYAEEALRSYMYYKIIERKSSVPANEKSRARAEYYNERRKANARLSNFTKEEALKTIRKNFHQAPKY
jgi:hypothetical protein